MSRIVDFPEHPHPQEADGKRYAGMPPSERFRLKQRQAYGKRRRLWHRIRVATRLALIPLLVGLWIMFPALPFWRFDAKQAVITGTDAFVTPEDVQGFLKRFDGQSLLQLNPAVMSKQFQQQYPLAYGVWFRRHLFSQILSSPMLTVHIDSQRPWAQMVTCPSEEATCHTWAVLTNRFNLINADKMPAKSMMSMLPKSAEVGDPSAVKAMPTLVPAQASSLENAPLLMIDMPADSHLLLRAEAREHLALALQQLQTLDKLTLKKLDLTNPINLVARFEQFDVQLGQLDAGLTTHRLPRLAHLVDPVLSGTHGKIDRIDLRWDKEVTFHRVGDAADHNISQSQ